MMQYLHSLRNRTELKPISYTMCESCFLLYFN
jgi:hypothetical protein